MDHTQNTMVMKLTIYNCLQLVIKSPVEECFLLLWRSEFYCKNMIDQMIYITLKSTLKVFYLGLPRDTGIKNIFT